MKKSEATRLTILQKAFELIYVKGYQTTSIDDILATTQVTKGAFYYHFKNKDEMGLAIISEILKPTMEIAFISPLQSLENPLVVIYDMMHHLLLENPFLKPEFGCPASNLIQEMTPWNTDFNNALNELTHQWEEHLIESLERGKQSGFVRKDVNARQVTLMVMSSYWGIRNLGKLDLGNDTYLPYLKELKSYLNSLH
ncbi:MAG: TetR family transcriptional regulator [Fluviicola sp.]|jgi:AcrR family transcriptional regulator|uniref:TetR/AcrR family transcriptional regulator n=1 Tax=Fluviicola sp. TaxID=1917219 RepID=UPI002622FEE5|nr:TetR/AcrR family transcriptional regulator [Fluviicola sp.]MDF3026103.1 TetR family transcriptional regulator [Fluviicola sp.]